MSLLSELQSISANELKAAAAHETPPQILLAMRADFPALDFVCNQIQGAGSAGPEAIHCMRGWLLMLDWLIHIAKQREQRLEQTSND
ncbi:MAG: hypothetical protein ACKO26_24820 [Planctomycetota bacterium]